MLLLSTFNSYHNKMTAFGRSMAGLLIARRLVRHMDALTMRRFICLVVMVDGVVMLFH